jgi:hypothetical protein
MEMGLTWIRVALALFRFAVFNRKETSLAYVILSLAHSLPRFASSLSFTFFLAHHVVVGSRKLTSLHSVPALTSQPHPMPPRFPLDAANLGRLGRTINLSACSSSSPSPSSPSIVPCRRYSIPTTPAHYAGPRTSRSFRRTKKEIEDRAGFTRTPRAPVIDAYIHRPSTVDPFQDSLASPIASSGLLRPVSIQNDPKGVLKETDGAMRLLSNSALVIVR